MLVLKLEHLEYSSLIRYKSPKNDAINHLFRAKHTHAHIYYHHKMYVPEKFFISKDEKEATHKPTIEFATHKVIVIA